MAEQGITYPDTTQGKITYLEALDNMKIAVESLTMKIKEHGKRTDPIESQLLVVVAEQGTVITSLCNSLKDAERRLWYIEQNAKFSFQDNGYDR